MQQWMKRLQPSANATKSLWENVGKTALRLGKDFSGKWLPTAMKGAASGLSGASKALEGGAKRLRKNAKPSRRLPFFGAVPVPVPIESRRGWY